MALLDAPERDDRPDGQTIRTGFPAGLFLPVGPAPFVGPAFQPVSSSLWDRLSSRSLPPCGTGFPAGLWILRVFYSCRPLFSLLLLRPHPGAVDCGHGRSAAQPVDRRSPPKKPSCPGKGRGTNRPPSELFRSARSLVGLSRPANAANLHVGVPAPSFTISQHSHSQPTSSRLIPPPSGGGGLWPRAKRSAARGSPIPPKKPCPGRGRGTDRRLPAQHRSFSLRYGTGIACVGPAHLVEPASSVGPAPFVGPAFQPVSSSLWDRLSSRSMGPQSLLFVPSTVLAPSPPPPSGGGIGVGRAPSSTGSVPIGSGTPPVATRLDPAGVGFHSDRDEFSRSPNEASSRRASSRPAITPSVR